MNKNQTTIEHLEALLLNQKSIFTVDELSRYTGLSKSFLYKKSAGKLIPHYKPSSKILIFKKEEIDAWLLSNKIHTVDDVEQQAINYVTRRTWNGTGGSND